MKLGWKRPAPQTLGSGTPSPEPCQHRFAPRIRRRSYWVRSSLITDTSVVCSNCGQSLDPGGVLHQFEPVRSGQHEFQQD